MIEKAQIRPRAHRASSAASSARVLQRKCACEGECEQCKQTLQRQPDTAASVQASAGIYGDLHSSGKPLDRSTRTFFECRFGHDFSRVRVHADSRAARLARSAGAIAYTHGTDIFFDQGRLAPHSSEGRRLLAHELTHVVQQAAPGNSGSATAEREAASVGERAPHGETMHVHTRTGPQIARQVGPLQRIVHYNRDQFGGRFDSEVDRNNHRVTLMMGVDFTPAGWPPKTNTDDVIAKFKTDMKKVVESSWFYQYALQSVCEADKYEAKVELSTNSQNPHASVYLHPDTPGGRSAAGDGASALQESDNLAEEHTRYFDAGKGKPPKQGTFEQTTTAHEFGHLMGLDHIRCKGNEDRCYGVTPEEAMDVMGIGSFVSQRDYAPFQSIMEHFGKDTLPAACNKWRLVAPG